MASVSRNTLSEEGALLPTKARMPSANAMSVAAGMAQPPSVSGVPQFSITKTSAGRAIPPTAAMPGRATSAGFFNLPSTISRFSSSPIRKKNTAISPSLIHRISGFSKPSPFRVTRK